MSDRPDNDARDRVIARVRAALGARGRFSGVGARRQAEEYVAARAHGPRPRMPAEPEALIARFMQRATDMESTVARIGSIEEMPAEVARYLDTVAARAPGTEGPPREGVCWPEFADLDWAGSQLRIRAQPTVGDDRLGITGTFCAVAETGTLVILPGPDAPTATALLPETHIAVVRAARVVSGMEEAFALIRRERDTMPRAINFISGPSRTGDIEQTIVLGAHGPYRVHILVVDR